MHASRGFSLIELMLALALGVIVTAGIVQLFVSNDQTYSLLTGQARMQEGARYALDFIARSARSSGYLGCDPDDDKVYSTLNGAWDDVFEFDLSRPVWAFNSLNTNNPPGVNDFAPSLQPGGAGPKLPRNTGAGVSVNALIQGNGITLANVRPGTDILVLRHVEVPGARTTQLVAPGGQPVIFDQGLDYDDDGNDFVVISNCEQAALFRVADVQTNTPAAGQATLTLDTGGGIFQNAPGWTLSDQGVPYGEATNSQGTTVGRVLTDIYFIARGAANNNNQGQPVWSLWRKTSEDPPVELVEGIEDLQVLFGIDTTPANNVPAANRYVTADVIAGANPPEVRSLRVSVTASSVDAVDGDGNVLRRTFSQTISYRNG